jgi:hypothetical protein
VTQSSGSLAAARRGPGHCNERSGIVGGGKKEKPTTLKRLDPAGVHGSFLNVYRRHYRNARSEMLAQRLHAAVIECTQKQRIGHIARDSTSIEARERFPASPPPKPIRRKPKRGPKPKRHTPPAAGSA